MQSPTLTDGRVTLREPAGAGDVDAVAACAADAETARWTAVPRPYSRDLAEELVHETAPRGWRTGTHLVLAAEVDGRCAGTVELRPDRQGAADLTFGLAPAARGRGVASAAVRLVLPWAAEHLGLGAVHWRAAVGDWAGRRVAWACGFAVEGRVRSLLAHRGGRLDAWMGSWRRGEPTRPRWPWLEAPDLVGPGVALRAGYDADAQRIVEACSARSTQQWLPNLPDPYVLSDARAYLQARLEARADGTGVAWTVTGADDANHDLLLGQVALMDVSWAGSDAEIGYWVHPDARGRGVATGAVRAATRHALLDMADGGLGLDRVLLKAADGNEASHRVAERAGFTAVGRDRRAQPLRDGRRVDFVRYDLVASELADALAHPAALR